MKLPPRTLKTILKDSVSYGAQGFCLSPYLFAFQIDEGYDSSAEYSAAASDLRFLARIRLWLQLLWGGQDSLFESMPLTYNAPTSRRMARRGRRKVPRARQACSMGYHILCRYGLKRLQQWLYNRTLTCRVAWCFRKSFCRGLSRRSFADYSGAGQMLVMCNAPLSPD